MIPILLIVGGLAWMHHHHKTTAKPTGAAAVGLTPARAAIHGELMGGCFNPVKLEKAAKLFEREGLDPQAKDLVGKAKQIRQQVVVAGQLAERARMNDQNAMGMIAAIREQAKQGNPRAIVSAKLIAEYCAKNPPKELGPLGETPIGPQQAAA